MYENGTRRSVETVLRRGGGWGRGMKGMSLRHTGSIFVNVIMYPQYNYNMLINK
jgi:hypothetical protein